MDIDVEPVSITWISRSGIDSAASVAAWNVAESFWPIVGQTIASAPASNAALNALVKSPGEGAAVVGKAAPAARSFCQNCSVERSTPARNSSAPNRTYSGTTVIPASAACWGVRSAVESVRTATVAKGSSSEWATSIRRSGPTVRPPLRLAPVAVALLEVPTSSAAGAGRHRQQCPTGHCHGPCGPMAGHFPASTIPDAGAGWRVSVRSRGGDMTRVVRDLGPLAIAGPWSPA